jgi:hypothetical protein
MGLRLEACVGVYWATGAIKPTYPLKEVMSRKRYDAIYDIYTRMGLAKADPNADPKAEFEVVWRSPAPAQIFPCSYERQVQFKIWVPDP